MLLPYLNINHRQFSSATLIGIPSNTERDYFYPLKSSHSPKRFPSVSDT